MMTKWTKEYRQAYMREYRAKNRDWIRVTWKLWYAANRKARNMRRRSKGKPLTAAVRSASLADKGKPLTAEVRKEACHAGA